MIRYLWAMPTTCIGFFLSLLNLPNRCSTRDGAVEIVCQGWLMRAIGIPAACFGHVILAVSRAEMERWRAHEHVHVKQYEHFGVLMLLLYPLSSLCAYLTGFHPYYDNHFEREAYSKTPPEHL